jgi:glycosyltransferase involved in cell wall biosynthesis
MPRAIRAMFVSPWGEALGGAESMLVNGIEGLSRRGVVPAVALLKPGPLGDLYREMGCEIFEIDAGRLREVQALRSAQRGLTRFIDSWMPDVVVGWSPKAHLYSGPASRRSRRQPTVLWWQHDIPRPSLIDTAATVVPADVVGCSSHAAAVAQRRLLPRRPTVVVHPGVRSSAMEARLPARPCIGLLGRLQPWKGQDRFIDALRLLVDQGHDVDALIVGGDAYELSPDFPTALREQVKRLRLDDRVTFTDQVAEPWPWLAQMTVLVNASEAEPFGMTVIEGLAAGVPVVAVASGGPAEIIRDSASGILVPSGAPKHLAAGIARLLRDPQLRARVATGGRERYLQAFTAEAFQDRLAGALIAVAGR